MTDTSMIKRKDVPYMRASEFGPKSRAFVKKRSHKKVRRDGKTQATSTSSVAVDETVVKP